MSLPKLKWILLVCLSLVAGLWIVPKRQRPLDFSADIAIRQPDCKPLSPAFVHSVIPKPSQLLVDTLHNLSLEDGVVIYYDQPDLKDFLQNFAWDLRAVLGVSVRLANMHSRAYLPRLQPPQGRTNLCPAVLAKLQIPPYPSRELQIITNTLDLRDNPQHSLASEAYQIRSIPEAQQIILSGTGQGIFYATRTLLQICYQQLSRKARHKLFPKLLVNDTPSFAYRGLHLDVARHFFPLPEVKKLIRLMSFYKLNKLHLHLSDDQGWRVQLQDFPRLISIGSIRKYTLIGRDRGNFQRHLRFDYRSYGGFYSLEDLRELSRYARQHAVEIIPEIDMPSHTNALIASYPFLACDSTEEHEVRGLWRGSKVPLCLGRERTYQFLFQLLSAVSKVFPGQYLHIGQDEVQTIAWEQCADCQKTMRRLHIDNLEDYRVYFQQRISSYVRAQLHRTPIIWDDNFNPRKADWRSILMVWKKPAHIREALEAKMPVIIADNNAFYLNYYQTKQYHQEPMSFRRRASMRKLYAYLLPSKVLGAQMLLWTEYIKDFATLQIKLLPRMIAGAESFWTAAARKDYADFLLRLKAHDLYLNREGFEYKYLD